MPHKNLLFNQLLISAKVNDVLSIRVPDYIKGYMQVEILNKHGKAIFSDIVDVGKQIVMEVKVGFVEKGQYFLKVVSDSNQFSVISFEKI
jgi:hypothetical protein